ncbi:tRNA (adenosine(37)-N6)-dimethylallyltransferase MiaA [Rickettsia endosymbiont of Cardiosporidium cionae]|uniref:tRNA (adenosine(37)-N6)-dimethylallyltransferase MiaA n=1 Tax=Rickettsia endosymbiont of Cardiosporidium cionae TaxID=2777155 RepID=UPI001894C0DB|nr:tRNA (adenosine(37)-N6)-dimethylallyltransferase MiaA [Rickettsia endosymbiont of Cardiosporidium cionae]KAF8818231.1 tRNA (adenosine(37)-N6)-dimethylallyltransferase MiaA [Rickettsia endosymbiont of Cardiosporidium cionae]
MGKSVKRVIVICGPTASNKTDFAHRLALEIGADLVGVVNADSMQIYKQIPIITSSPSKQLQEKLGYYLYNFLDVNRYFSVDLYCKTAIDVIKNLSNLGSTAILVSGSGMYINSLIYGYHNIPSIELNVKQEAKYLYDKFGREVVFNILCKKDPLLKTRININDSQRICRAYEVLLQTGSSILDFYQERYKISSLKDFTLDVIMLLPERNYLYDLCRHRLYNMFSDNLVIEEIRSLLDNFGVINNPAIHALGIKEIIAYLQHKISLEKAIELIFIRTKQYAKRQITWFSNKLRPKQIINFSDNREYLANSSISIKKISDNLKNK